jgi:NADP-dependent 3-hydroxy acid dehydrogenase YdfG
MDLTGKTALVTGSTQGIGFAIAEGLATSGARVAVNGRTPERVEEAVAKLRGDIVGVAVGVTTEDGVAQLLRELPDVDILVNNLGIFGAVPAREITDEQWRTHFEVNVLAAARLIRLYLPGMSERGWGRAIQIASDSALVIPEEMVHYGVSKTARWRCHADSPRPPRVPVSPSIPSSPGRRTPQASRTSSTNWSTTRCHGTWPSASSCATADRSRCCSGSSNRLKSQTW